MRVLAAIITVTAITMTAYPDAIVFAGPPNILDYVGRTCSGDEAKFGIRAYFFGFSKPGLCMTRVFYANTYEEALECAQAVCPPDCRIEDITGWYQFNSSVQKPGGKKGYCLE